MAKRALMSVSDKTGILEFAQALTALGYEILSTGGTLAALRAADVPAIAVSDVTGFPECLDGRVKTLHPAIHAGILAMRDNPEHMAQLKSLGIQTIDLVVINLYPFKATIQKPGVAFEEAIENIDIGGPTMLRAAAKNWQDVAVVVNPSDYGVVLEELQRTGDVSRATKQRLCYQVFAHTAQYDALISEYLYKQLGDERLPAEITIPLEKVQEMRYGENPHQKAAFYRDPLPLAGSLACAKQLHGKELSYNNIGDADGALELLREFDTPCAIAVKHANPCGVGLGDTIYDAYLRAYDADPVSIFGGIVALNRPVDEATAKELAKTFLEIIIAPGFDAAALEILTKKKNIRLLELDTDARAPKDTLIMKRVFGGMLVQQMDLELLGAEGFTVVTKRAPTEGEIENMLLAWRIVKHTKSNGIAIAKDKQSVGVGPGQVNRIWATQQAIEHGGEKVRGAALASDAYFPFGDCVQAAAAAGITAIIQPGGSMRDQESIEAADAAGIAMVYTGMRHFKH